MMNDDRYRVCPVECAGTLDSRFRRWLQNPQKILTPYVGEGMRVLDIGCGPGFFSIEMAKMVGPSGKVISADLQEGMLQKLRAKIRGTELEGRITPVLSDRGSINVPGPVDFILAFYVVHEVPDRRSLFAQLHSILVDNGQCLLVEPKLFHVSRQEFETTIGMAEQGGFRVLEGPRLGFSWSAILKHA